MLMIKIIKSDEHYRNQNDWLDTTHHFSFGEYMNPDKMNFGPLRVFNDDTIKPAKGFGFHQHHDMEIVTYVIDGELEHKDNYGNHGVIYPGEVQRMTAGSGIMHSEYNHSTQKPLRLLQIWVFPNKKNLKPSWEQQKFLKKETLNKFLPIIESESSINEKILHIHQDTSFYISTVTPDKEINYILKNKRNAYVFVIDGKVVLNHNHMESRDAAKVENENRLSILAIKESELLLIDLPEKYALNN